MRSCEEQVECPICKRKITKINITKHLNSHTTHPKYQESLKHRQKLDHDDLVCKYCGKECKNKNSLIQHEVRCRNNPNRIKVAIGFNNKGRKAWNKGLTKETDERLAKAGAAISKTKKGCTGHPQSEETKQLLHKIAIHNGLGGFNMRNKGIDYKGIKLDSSYEVEVAKSLDANNIKWKRCKRFPYVVEGKLHYYTPDFYLPEYNVYLEPKNDFLLNNINPRLRFTDIYKVEQVMLQNNIKVIILNKDQLTWDYIKQQI